MRSLLVLASALSLATPCAPAQSGPAPAPTLEEKVAEIAKVMNSIAPKKLEGGLSLDSVVARGRTLVLKMSGLPKWRPNVSDAEAGKMLGAAICDRESTRRLIAEGASFAIEGRTADGEALPLLPICLA